MLAFLLATDSQTQATSVFKAFGYPDVKPKLVRRTESGGAEFSSGTMSLLIDKNGVPRWFKIKNVRFEQSQASKTLPRIESLLSQFPLALPTGRWVTERSLAPHPYGNARASSRYFFVPWLDGYPFLRSSQMTVQFSADSKRVLEWAVHQWSVARTKAPKRLLSYEAAKKRFQEIGDRAAQRHEKSHATVDQPELGWLGRTNPVLAYTCRITVFVKLKDRTRGSGGWVDINAETGSVLERPIR